MAASELNNRLDYLVSYASQLVFICSDNIQQQSQLVENFLIHQNVPTDLALLTANELTPLVSYREKLFRQLISQSQEADFNKPLCQLLAPLNQHTSPIIISVFQGEKLPNKLVKELWDLVLQSRFGNNKQHLNVLLIGLSDWAESTKLGLGAKSKQQPIILKNHTDIQHTEANEFSDLASYIQHKREKFAQRVEERKFQAYVSQPIYKKFWLATLFTLVFLSTFAGLLSWQYSDKVSVIISYINTQLTTQKQPINTSDNIDLSASIASKTAQAVSQPIQVIAAPAQPVITTKVNTKDQLVTDWHTASAKLAEQSNNVLFQTTNIQQPNKVTVTHSTEPEQPMLVKYSAAQTDTVNGHQVADKLEFEAIVVEQNGVQLGKLEPEQTDNVLNPKHTILLALPNDNFVIQIAAMANINILQDYVKNTRLGQQLWLYKTQRYGGDWYVLLLKQHFTAIEDARAAIANLDDALLIHTPFVKPIAKVKQEITAFEP